MRLKHNCSPVGLYTKQKRRENSTVIEVTILDAITNNLEITDIIDSFTCDN